MRYQLFQTSKLGTHTYESFFVFDKYKQARSIRYQKSSVNELFDGIKLYDITFDFSMSDIEEYNIIAESDMLEELQLLVPWLFI